VQASGEERDRKEALNTLRQNKGEQERTRFAIRVHGEKSSSPAYQFNWLVISFTGEISYKTGHEAMYGVALNSRPKKKGGTERILRQATKEEESLVRKPPRGARGAEKVRKRYGEKGKGQSKGGEEVQRSSKSKVQKKRGVHSFRLLWIISYSELRAGQKKVSLGKGRKIQGDESKTRTLACGDLTPKKGGHTKGGDANTGAPLSG